MHKFFFTIITATYNAAATLPRLLDSLAEQTCRDFELIIQDGASTDNTVAIAESYRDKLPSLSLVSEPDTGIYDAWNKAIKRTTGEWVIFLGADDTLIDAHVLDNVHKKLNSISESTIFAAGSVLICNGGQEFFAELGLGEDAPVQLRAGSGAVHSGLFQRSKIFAHSTFDTTFSIVGDHDFVIRNWRFPKDGFRLNLPVTRMSIGGVTGNLRSLFRFRCEFAKVMYRHYGLKIALPYIKGAIKASGLHILLFFFSAESVLLFYNKARAIRKLPPTIIK